MQDNQVKKNLKENYRDNTKLKQSGVDVQFTQQQVDEFRKCAKSPLYFIKKYFQINTLDGGVMKFKPHPFQEELIKLMHNNRWIICKCPRQVGKALNIETPILTPNGFVLLKDLNVGDKIYGPDGKETNISFITETMKDRPCYELTFSNGEKIVADEEHLWEVGRHSNWRKNKVLTTGELLQYMGSGQRVHIEYTKPLEFEEKEQIIDPYLLGVWLGDGETKGGRITCHKDDLFFYMTQFNIGYTYYSTRNPNTTTNTIYNLSTKLKELEVHGNKHIPQNYLMGSYEQRLALLQGLMDTDGSVSKQNGVCEFYQKKEMLLDQVRFLLTTLGIKSTKRSHYDSGVEYFTLTFSTNLDVFRLPRKLEIQQKIINYHPKLSRIYIEKIEKVNSVPVRCLQVDNENHLFLAGTGLIPTHNTTVVIAYLAWQVLFTDNQNILVAANKRQTAEDILAKFQLAYENIPLWLQQGVEEWNKGNIKLENGSKIRASSTTSSAARSGSYNIVVLDEFAHIDTKLAEEFYTSVYPVISSGKTTKIFMISTPKGMNLFYSFWTKAVEKENNYIPFEVHWSDVPGRDKKWYDDTITNIGQERFEQEFNCEFLGSTNTLISGSKLKHLASKKPLFIDNEINIYKHPVLEKWDEEEEKQLEIDHKYVICVDTSEGRKLDSSAFTVVDITKTPYELVATYASNIIAPLLYPSIIWKAAKYYNDAYVLIEAMTVGQQVADILHSDLEYENIIRTFSGNKKSQSVSQGFTPGAIMGVKTTAPVKRIGCQNLKTLIETDQLLIQDETVITELTTFTLNNKGSYEADTGCHDDLVMTLVLFSWLTTQKYFKELITHDLRKELRNVQLGFNDEEMLPIPVIEDGIKINLEQLDHNLWVDDKDAFSIYDPYKNYW